MRTIWLKSAVFLASGLALMAALPAGAASPDDLLKKFRIAPPVVEASSPEAGALWVKSFGSGTGLDDAGFIKQASDGGLYLSGTTTSFGAGGTDLLLVKLDDAGSVLWARAYGTAGNDTGTFIPIADGGFVAVVTSDNQGAKSTTLIRVDSAGTFVGQIAPAISSGSFTLNGIFPTSTGYYLVGSARGANPIATTFFIVKLDASGDPVWSKEYGYADPTIAVMGALPEGLADGTTVIGGTVVNMLSGDSDLFLAKLDASGNILWQKAYGGASQEFGGVALSTPDGGFVMEGYTQSWGMGGSAGDFWLLKLDGSGNITWQKAYGGAGDEGIGAALDGSGFLVSGSVSATPGGPGQAFAMKLDGSGNVAWQKLLAGAGEDSAYAVPDGAGGYLLSSETGGFGGGGSDVWVLRMDGSGAITWQKTYGGASGDTGFCAQVAGGNLVISGSTSTGASANQFWAAKTSSNGEVVTGCPWVHDGQGTASAGSLAVTPTTAVVRPLGMSAASITASGSNGSLVTTPITLPASTVCSGAPPVNPPVVALIKKASPPFKLVVSGSNLQSGIKVFINGAEWASVAWKNTGKIQLTGAIKTAVPKGTTNTFRFLNPDGGEFTQTWGW